MPSVMDKDHRGVGAGFFDGFHAGVENGGSDSGLATTAGGHTTDQVCAVFFTLSGVKFACLAGDALANQACLFIDQNAHGLEFSKMID